MLLSSQPDMHNDSELLGSCAFPGVCLHLLSRVSLRGQGRYSAEGMSRAYKSHRATRQVGEAGAVQYCFASMLQLHCLKTIASYFNYMIQEDPHSLPPPLSFLTRVTSIQQ